MRLTVKMLLAGVTCFAIPLTLVQGMPTGHAQKSQTMKMSSAAKPVGKLTRIDANKICMVTNRAYAKPEIPVTVDGRTYYGCCDMCKGMLQSDPARRVAIDPISQKKVDKSLAVIGAAANGGVLYFENTKDLDIYNSRVGASK